MKLFYDFPENIPLFQNGFTFRCGSAAIEIGCKAITFIGLTIRNEKTTLAKMENRYLAPFEKLLRTNCITFT